MLQLIVHAFSYHLDWLDSAQSCLSFGHALMADTQDSHFWCSSSSVLLFVLMMYNEQLQEKMQVR